MPIKQLEKENNQGLIAKAILLFFLIGGAAVYSFFSPKLNKKPASVKASNFAKATLDKSAGKEMKGIIDDVVKQTQDTTGIVLGEATKLANTIASQSAETVSDFIFDKTIAPIIQQIDKLPKQEQEKIKETICK